LVNHQTPYRCPLSSGGLGLRFAVNGLHHIVSDVTDVQARPAPKTRPPRAFLRPSSRLESLKATSQCLRPQTRDFSLYFSDTCPSIDREVTSPLSSESSLLLASWREHLAVPRHYMVEPVLWLDSGHTPEGSISSDGCGSSTWKWSLTASIDSKGCC
jgi:hypothetical protein